MSQLSTLATSIESSPFFQLITQPLFHYKDVDITLLSILSTIFIIIIGFSVGRIFKKKVLGSLTAISIENRVIISNLGYYGIIFFTVVTALHSVGVDLSSLAIVAGALSVGIGFGLQNIVSNFVAGIILMFEKSIRVGDVVEIDKNIRGKIVDIKMRSTTLVNADNMDIVVPNSNFIQNVVTNSTMRDSILRIHAPFTLAHNVAIDEAIVKLLEAFNASSLQYIKNTNDKKPTVIITSLVEKGVECELLFFVDITYSSAQAKSDALKIVYEVLGNELVR